MAHLFADPTFWVAVAFVVAIAIVARPLSRMALAGLDNRRQRIADELEEARRLREEAQALLAAQERRQREASREAEAILAQAGEEADRLAKQAAEELERQVERRRQQAEERIAQAEADAMRELRAATAELALKAARKLLGDKLDEARQARLVDQAIDDIGQRLH